MPDTGAVQRDPNKHLIDMLRRSRLFRDYERVFADATGLALAIRPLEFWQLAHRGKKHENPFCALLAENPATLTVCLRAHQEMIDHTGVLPHTVTCPFGLTETAVPIKLGEQIVAASDADFEAPLRAEEPAMHRHPAARDQARDHLGDQRGLAGAAPAREADEAHGRVRYPCLAARP